MKKFRQENGEPDVIQIRKTFAEKQKCELWEERVLTKILHSEHKTKWLNKAICKKLYGYQCLSEESRNKMRLAKLGSKQDPETVKKRIEKMTETRRKNDNWKVSEETKKLISERTSEAMKGIKFTEEHKKNLSLALKGKKKKPLSEEHKRGFPSQ